MSDLIDTTEMYLRTILVLEEEGHVPMRARITERLDQSGPTVSETVARMEKNGLVVVSGDRHLELTVEGRKHAIEVMRKHRLAELLLSEIIGLEWHQVHEEACRWEHVMSEQVERKILDLVSNSSLSPFGNPIPGLELLGAKPAKTEAVVPLIEVIGQPVILKRIAEPLQGYPNVLAHFKAAGIVPEAVITASEDSKGIQITAQQSQHSVSLTAFDLAHIFVKAL